jgi:hypothetical protein
VNYGSTAVLEKALNLIQRYRGQRLEKSDAKSLRNRRVDSVEDDVRARALDPGGASLRIETMARFSKLQARLPFGTLELPGKIEIGKCHGTGNGTQVEETPQCGKLCGTIPSPVRIMCPQANRVLRFRTSACGHETYVIGQVADSKPVSSAMR